MRKNAMPGRWQAFPTSEFEARVKNVQAAMRDREIDLLLLHSPENIYYLTGYQTSGYFAYQMLVVPPRDTPVLLVRYLERGNVHEYSWLETYETWKEGDDVAIRSAAIINKLGAENARIGIEKSNWFLTLGIAERLRTALPGVAWSDASQLVEKIRIIKSERELSYIARAGAIAEAEMRAAMEVLRDGVTEAEVAAAVHHAGVLRGCEYTGLPHHIMSGHRYDVCHANWSPKKIVKGELVLLELYGCVERYHATQMRTFSIGNPSRDAQEAADLVVKSQDEALKALRPGASSLHVDRLVRQPIRMIRPDYYNRSGYSTGIGFPPRTAEWETLDFNEQSDWIVREGMAFHMLALAKGFGISETVIVTVKGGERVTPDNPRQLIVV
jgi:Xaa-Pro dipeptidase